MSNYRQYNTKFKERELLEKSLAGLGLVVSNTKEIVDYYGKSHKVDFAVEGTSLPAGRIGFVAQSDGTYKIEGDFHYYNGMSPEKFGVELKKTYNANFVIAKAEEIGCTMVEDCVVNGKRRIVMQRMVA